MRFLNGCKRCVQFLTALLISILMLGALVLNKVSLVWLLGGNYINHNVRLEIWYAAFGLVLVVPETVALIKVLWNTSFIKKTRTHQWPSGVALFVGMMVSFAEVSSFLVFTLEVAPRLPVQVLLPLLSSVFSVTLCYDLWENVKFTKYRKSELKYDGNFTLTQKNNDDTSSCHESMHHHSSLQNWKRIIQTVLGFSGVWASCAIAGIATLTTPLPWFQALCLPASLCLLALCWNPKVQVYIVRSYNGTFMGRWKAACLYTIFKLIILIIGLCIVMMIRLRIHGLMDKNFFTTLLEGISSCGHPAVLYPLMIHFGSSLLAHGLSYVAATLCVTGIGMTIPSMAATPAAIGLVMYLCMPQFSYLDEVICHANGIGIWCACTLAGIIWMAPYIVKGSLLNRSSNILLKPFDELFIQPTWNSIFLDQNMFLNYKYDGFQSTEHISRNNKDVINRIFMCTTMFREADWEMGRLLKSLCQVSKSKKLKDVYLEAHIFMDNGTNDLHLTDFASQLISLLEDKIGVTPGKGNAYMSPYGIQLNWTLPGGMPFFIHLKDPMKIKAKKRWSQVMYMSYVLNYRVLRDHSRDKLMPLPAKSMASVEDCLFVGYASDKEWENNTAALNNDDSIADRSTSPTGNQTPYYIRENRKSLECMFEPPESEDPGQSSSNSRSTGTSSRFSSDTPQISSDQGICVSDEMSDVSSSSAKLDDAESSEPDPSRPSSFKGKDEGWQDYEGDVSSNNENSLTSLKARRITERAKGFMDDSSSSISQHRGVQLMSRHSVAGSRPVERPVRPKRHQSQPLRNHHVQHKPRSRKESGPRSNKIQPLCVDKALLLQNCESSSNLASELSDNVKSFSPTASLGMQSVTLYRPMIAFKTTTPAHAISMNKAETDIFTISRKTVPSVDNKAVNKKRTTLDDHTYILATDADMEFTEDSVVDLLNLCNRDRRLGGACGRTHPIGQRSGPLVWYQKFEYAKDFWMIKSAQNVIGSVMCCPGCFSLYRASAVRDIMANYAGPTESAFDVFIKDTGEDRWMCTLMMLHGWKLEYTAFCDNTTYCPDSFQELMRQRRRWVLSDMANMLLVFKNIFKLARKNDSFSIAYILYMLQMFSIVLLSPASTVVILAGGLDIVYGIPFEIVASGFGVLILAYALICLVGSVKLQTRTTFGLAVFMGLAMLLVVIGGSVYVVHDIMGGNYTTSVNGDIIKPTLIPKAYIRNHDMDFQEYYLIVLLIGALLFAAIIHPKETFIICHGLSYLLGFPAMQILLPIYAISNIVDPSWGTRDQNESKSPPVSCFSKHRKKYHKSLSKASTSADTKCRIVVEEETEDKKDDSKEDSASPIECTTNAFKPMNEGQGQQIEEYSFWERMRQIVLGTNVNLGLDGPDLANGLRNLRNICLLSMLILNALWLTLLSVLYFNADLNLARLNMYGLIAACVYGLVLVVQWLGMTIHRTQAVFTRFARVVFGANKPVWIHPRAND